MKKLKHIMVFSFSLISLVFAGHALAKNAKPTPAKLSIDKDASSFTWKATKKIGGGHYGDISLQSATAQVSNGKIISGEFVMDMTSFTVTDLKGSDFEQKFLDHVKSGDFFEVAKHPTAQLIIEKQIGKNQVQGKLTIKKITQPVNIKFKKAGNNYIGTLSFDRTKFNIKYNSSNYFKVAADKVINDEVTLDFKVTVK